MSVIPWNISIEPVERIIHVGVGQELRLSCIIKTGPVSPVFIFWYRNHKIVEYDDTIGAHVSIKMDNNSNAGIYTSDLLLNQVTEMTYTDGEVQSNVFLCPKVGVNDSGEYRCGSDLTGEAAVRVNVVAGENEQELKSYFSESEFGNSVCSPSSNSGLAVSAQIAIVIGYLWIS